MDPPLSCFSELHSFSFLSYYIFFGGWRIFRHYLACNLASGGDAIAIDGPVSLPEAMEADASIEENHGASAVSLNVAKYEICDTSTFIACLFVVTFTIIPGDFALDKNFSSQN